MPGAWWQTFRPKCSNIVQYKRHKWWKLASRSVSSLHGGFFSKG